MKNALFIAPHVDDSEISCGGTIAKLVEKGIDVCVVTFSHIYGEKNLMHEFQVSMDSLGIADYDLYGMSTRYFNQNTQTVAEKLRYLEDQKWDMVFTTDPNDRHPDHATIGRETIRIFGNSSIVTYCSPFNSLSMDENYYIEISEAHLEKKLAALACYKSQQHRTYMQPEVVRANAVVRGLQSGFKLAEAFRVVKLRDAI